jgi:hypothetical protein
MVAAHGNQCFTGGEEWAAEAIGAGSLHGEGERSANDVSVSSWSG